MRRLTSIAGLLLALLASGCARAEPPVPLLWKVSDGDNALYLLGSFHLLRPEDYPLDPRTAAAFDDAERLVFELSPAELDGGAVAGQMLQAARRSDGRRLQDTLPPATWARLQDWATRNAMPVDRLQGFEAWYVGLLVSLREMQRQGLDPALGLDRHFAGRATAAGKDVEGLETGAAQIALFDGMDAAQQVQALEEALQSPEELERSVRELHGLWRAGDGRGLYEGSGARLREQYPDLYERINADRNRAWLTRLQALLDEGGHDQDALVVVGAMHLLGDDGVVALLRAEGYDVERL